MESLRDSVAKLDQLKLAGIISEAEYTNLKRELIDNFISVPAGGDRAPAALASRGHPYTSPASWPVYRVVPPQGMVLEQPTVSGWYSNDKNVKVQPLPEDTTEDDIRAVFGTFGEITTVALKGGYAYVNFKTRQAARAAVAAPKQSLLFGGTPVLVTPEKPKGMYGSPMLAYAGYPGYDAELGFGLQRRGKGRGHPKGPPIPKNERRVLLVTFMELTGPPPTTEQLYEYCCPYGTVVRISLVSKPDREQALIQFAEPDAAQAALDGLNQYSLGYCKLDVQWGRHLELTFKTSDERNRDFVQFPPGQPPPPKWQQLEGDTRPGQAPLL
eukprot:TRINITY_DN9355_c0_g1_i1.p1 TRINITY_DN9355_c0_g1~~TRINITY_DN9355_c0_g1_i1.p1  ORF type:complete len:356 (+),score=46.80 TRINITY_DN9355_c0_g1_i1:90-1070(+)